VTLKGSGPEDTNSITQPAKIVPVTSEVDGLSADFTRAFPPYSVSVLVMKGK
jgi:alpha-N-arabinofuranosidase